MFWTQIQNSETQLTSYFNLRANPVKKDRDLDPRSNFILLYFATDIKAQVIGGVRHTTDIADSAYSPPLHIEKRAGISLSTIVLDKFGISLQGQNISETASIIIDPEYRGKSEAIKTLNLGLENLLTQNQTDIAFFAPYPPHDEILLRYFTRRNAKTYSIGHTTVIDDNVEQGRKKHILAVPLTQKSKQKFVQSNVPAISSTKGLTHSELT